MIFVKIVKAHIKKYRKIPKDVNCVKESIIKILSDMIIVLNEEEELKLPGPLKQTYVNLAKRKLEEKKRLMQ